MPRRYSRRRNFRKKRSSRQSGWRSYNLGNVADTASKGYSLAKWAVSMLNVEKKVKNFSFSDSVSTSGRVHILNGCAQGDGIDTRDGNSLKAKSVAITGDIRWSGASTNAMLRMVLLYDNQQVGDTAPSLADIFGSATPSQYAQLNPETLGRFSILADKRFVMTNINQQGASRIFKITKKLNRHSRYNGANSTDIQKNGLYLISWSNEATNTPTLNYESFFRFVDN
jgi:hypothetical protein